MVHFRNDDLLEFIKFRNSLNPHSDPVWRCFYNQPTLQMKKLKLRGAKPPIQGLTAHNGGVPTHIG